MNHEEFELVQGDRRQTQEVINGVIQVSNSLRTWATTVVVALVAVCVDRQTPLIGLSAVAAALIFALLDARNSVVYEDARDHMVDIESVFRDWYVATRSNTNTGPPALSTRYAYGLFANLSKPSRRQILRMFFTHSIRGVYSILIVVAAGVTLYTATTTSSPTKCTLAVRGSTIECGP